MSKTLAIPIMRSLDTDFVERFPCLLAGHVNSHTAFSLRIDGRRIGKVDRSSLQIADGAICLDVVGGDRFEFSVQKINSFAENCFAFGGRFDGTYQTVEIR